MTRRLILKGGLALAAYLVLPTSSRSSIDHDISIERFKKDLDNGVIENYVFRFNSPIKIEKCSNLIIQNCVFEFNYPSDECSIIVAKGVENLYFNNIEFKTNSNKKSIIHILEK